MDDRRPAMLVVMGVHPGELEALRAGRLTPSLARRVRGTAVVWVAFAAAALLAVALAAVFAVVTGEVVAWISIPVGAVGAGWLASRGVRTWRDIDVDVVEGPALKTRSYTSGRWNEAIVIGVDRFPLDMLSAPAALGDLVEDGAMVRAYVTRRARHLVALEPLGG